MNKNLRAILLWTLILVFGFLVGRYSGRIFIGQPAPVPKPKISDGPELQKRQPISTIDFVKLFPKLVTRQGSPRLSTIALTFDDGPDLKYTPKILDILKKYNVKATFFVVGAQIEKYPATFRRLLREGHEIGNHGYRHVKIPQLSPVQLRDILTKNSDLIRRSGGPRQTIFRPPYGTLDPASVHLIGSQGYRIVLWTVDSLDWRGLKRPQVVKNVVPHLKQGYIVLQHCAAESKLEDLSGSLEALPEIIGTAKKLGYRFVTISQLLREAK